MELTTRIRSTTRQLARSAYTVASQATTSVRMRPDFLIAGAQRCGTTSLFRMMAKHPDVKPPALSKGVHYFDTAERFARGPKFYAAHFPLALGSASKVTGEASPYYIFHPLAPERISQHFPGIRIIVLLRDPVERAYSAHKQETWRGFETLGFEEALDAEEGRLYGEVERILSDPNYQSFEHQHHAYVARGQYAPQLRRMADAVGRENVLALDADLFFTDPGPQWERVLAHIGLQPTAAVTPVQANARPSSPMTPAIRLRLENQFTESDEDLESFLGHKPSWR